MQHAATSTSKNRVSLFAIMIADFCNKIGNSVAKVAEAKLWNRNLKQSNQPAWIFESTLRSGSDLESISCTRKSKIVLQH
ncbi:MAG TPA: hypothetical protein VF014_06415, partial [Casimicrobiaceae bacterium]|nr:hypothetical protein [Casimicrobiaceae bacterium]